MKKIITAMICLIILISSMGLVTSQNIEVSKDSVKVDENNDDPVDTFTIYRIDSNGDIFPIEVCLENTKNKDIGQALEDICTKLFENDEEMQQYIGSLGNDNSNTSSNLSFKLGMVRVKSHGRGFHFKTKIKVEILIKFKFFKIMLPHIRTSTRRSVVFCNYPSDEKAKTTYHSIIGSYLNENATKTIVLGNHSVFVRHFIGYTTWFGRFSNPLTDFIPRAFSGIGRYVVCNQFD